MGVLLLLIFAGILALNAIRDRFWCRYLCPLGALLGLVSRVAWLRREVGDVCTECQRCARACPVGTIDPRATVRQRPGRVYRVPGLRPGLRQGRPGLHRPRPPCPAAGLRSVAAAVHRFSRSSGGRCRAVRCGAGRRPRRPAADPPARARRGLSFLSKCIRCGICLKVCPTSGLQPSLAQAGWSGLWTPVLVPRLGCCDYGCNACGGACPTGAIPPLALEDKRLAVIGHAYIDQDRCLPWADNITCLVCEEMCPVPEKAIILEDVTVMTPNGRDGRRPASDRGT